MASPSPLMIMWASLLLLLLFSATSPCVAGGQFAGLNRITSKRRTIRHITHFRGGAFVDSDEEYDSDEYDSDDEDEPIVAKAKKLASSTKNKVQKAKGAAAKAKVSVAMASSGGGDGGLGGLYRHYVPYIIRACLNPFTLLSMTKGYFISLFDINYLREVSRDTSSPGYGSQGDCRRQGEAKNRRTYAAENQILYITTSISFHMLCGRRILEEKTSRSPNLDPASFLLRRSGWGVSAVLKAVFMDSRGILHLK